MLTGIAQVAEATISIKRLQSFMMYEDTSKPVPGLAEIQTSTKSKVKKEETRESLLSIKEDVPKEESKDSGLAAVTMIAKTTNLEAKGNGKKIISLFYYTIQRKPIY